LKDKYLQSLKATSGNTVYVFKLINDLTCLQLLRRLKVTDQLEVVSLRLVDGEQRLGSTVELHLSGPWLSGSSIIRIGLVLRVHLSTIYETNFPWNNRLSDQVQYSVMASRTSDQAWLKVLDAGTICK